jgi:hypothetical protein
MMCASAVVAKAVITTAAMTPVVAPTRMQMMILCHVLIATEQDTAK